MKKLLFIFGTLIFLIIPYNLVYGAELGTWYTTNTATSQGDGNYGTQSYTFTGTPYEITLYGKTSAGSGWQPSVTWTISGKKGSTTEQILKYTMNGVGFNTSKTYLATDLGNYDYIYVNASLYAHGKSVSCMVTSEPVPYKYIYPVGRESMGDTLINPYRMEGTTASTIDGNNHYTYTAYSEPFLVDEMASISFKGKVTYTYESSSLSLCDLEGNVLKSIACNNTMDVSNYRGYCKLKWYCRSTNGASFGRAKALYKIHTHPYFDSN